MSRKVFKSEKNSAFALCQRIIHAYIFSLCLESLHAQKSEGGTLHE